MLRPCARIVGAQRFDAAEQQLAFALEALELAPGRRTAAASSAGSSTCRRWPCTPCVGEAAHALLRSSRSGDRKSPISTTWAWRGSGSTGGRLSFGVPAAAAARRGGSARRGPSTGPRGRSPSSAMRSPPRTSSAASASVSSSARSSFSGQVSRSEREAHRGRGVAPQPDALRRLPFGLAHEQTLATSPICRQSMRLGGVAGVVAAELPEGLALADAPPAVHALRDGRARPARRPPAAAAGVEASCLGPLAQRGARRWPCRAAPRARSAQRPHRAGR